MSFIEDFKFFLTFKGDASLSKFNSQGFLINGFKES